MTALIFIAIAGFAAQLVDGGLGMGFGATSTTILISLAALGPAQASAVVHVAELGTTLASGISHWKFGNVYWPVVLRLAIPGSVGAFLGATLLSRLSTEAARPITATILAAIGMRLIVQFSRGRARRTIATSTPSSGFLAGLGFFGGFIDASGGGGWGPVTTSTLLSLGREEPRRIVGTVSTAEFLVTSAAVAGFVAGLWNDLVAHLAAVVALLVGGVIAAPIAAWLVSRLNPAALGTIVGTLLVVLHLPTILEVVGIGGAPVLIARLVVLAAGVMLAVVGWRRYRRNAAATEAPEKDISQTVAARCS